jgi:carboxymethylenebutenolidase
MCDEFTAADDDGWLARHGLSRRDFTRLGAVVAGAALTGCGESPAESAEAAAALVEATVTIPTPDGKADAFFVHPAKGQHPGVLMWPDIAGLREAYQTMARRLAAAGYAVLAVNQYYRSGPAPVVATMAEWRTPEGRAKLEPMIALITPEVTSRDAAVFVGFLDAQPATDPKRKLGTMGYCMGGPFALRTAAAAPARVGAAASFHGANLVSDRPDSPHLLFAAMKASLLIAIARNDDERQPEAKTTLRQAADAAGRKAEIEVYPAQHGWCTIDAPVYDKVQAEKAWGRMLALYQAAL